VTRAYLPVYYPRTNYGESTLNSCATNCGDTIPNRITAKVGDPTAVLLYDLRITVTRAYLPVYYPRANYGESTLNSCATNCGDTIPNRITAKVGDPTAVLLYDLQGRLCQVPP
jgi:hypothetical protein